MSNHPRAFPFATHPARQGFVWLAQAYRMFRQHRIAWVVLLLGYYLVLWLLHTIPFLGSYALALMKPVVSVGLLAAAWRQERGGTPALSQLLQGFRTNLWALFAIGIFYVIGITMAVFGSSLADGGKLLEFMAAGSRMTEEQMAAALADRRLQVGMLFSALLAMPVVVAAWWAPALVVFQDARAGNALAASLRAALANWRPLAVYGLGVFFYGVVVPGIFIAIVALVVPPPAGQVLLVAMLVPYSLFFAATLHVSDYVSYRDVFHAGETLTPLGSGQPSKLG